jgi:transglutaminase-like putative cysteine protease
MLIRLGFDIQFEIPSPVPMIALYHVHHSRHADLREPDEPRITPTVTVNEYEDSFGNLCARFVAPAGKLQLYNSTLIEDSGEPDLVSPQACQLPVEELPHEVLRYLLASRYCEVDRCLDIAGNLFGNLQPGWPRVQAVCDWVQTNVTFGYQFASPTKTALDLYADRKGVCRVLSLLEYPRPVCHRISGGHRSSSCSADGLQCLVRGLPAGSLVDIRCP